ncbi:MAG: phenylacetate--CoA ligase [Deltaproteobacteria bacterium]|nr:phenylacetate--CoA ligase [Deltaproteobacteria bacterium]
MYWQKELETMEDARIRRLQLKRLRETVRAASRSTFYRERFQQLGLSPEDICTLDSLRKLPFTTKNDLRQAYPFGFLAVPKGRVVRMHASTGTTGRSTVVFYTRADLDQWTDLVARCMVMTGARQGDVFQNMTGYGLFTGGLGFHYAAERLGIFTIPIGSGNTRRQIHMMREFETTVIHCIPSFALYMVHSLQAMGIDPRRDLPLRIAFLGAEPHSEHVRRKVEELYGVDAFNSYGLSEMYGPGVAFECPAKDGMHLWEDAYLPEIVDPGTGEPVEDGAKGELVLTSLGREAMPLLRYRTGDLTAFCTGECGCGRRHRRIRRIIGRADDMFIIKGVNIFPTQVEEALLGMEEVGNNYQIILKRKDYTDIMTVTVEVQERFFRGDPQEREQLRRRMAKRLREELLVTPDIELLKPGALESTGGKAVRVVDKRDIYEGGISDTKQQ